VTRLSALGTILAQNVQIDDLQESIDGYDRELQRLEAQLATVKAQLTGTLTEAERARLEERRAQLKAQLDQYRASRAATAAEARLATFQLELRTEKREGAPVPGSRLDRALDKALAVLTWEAVVALAFAVAVAPLVLLGVVLWGGRRMHRRRDEDRLLAAS
jgi:regulator of replication initiation timing